MERYDALTDPLCSSMAPCRATFRVNVVAHLSEDCIERLWDTSCLFGWSWVDWASTLGWASTLAGECNGLEKKQPTVLEGDIGYDGRIEAAFFHAGYVRVQRQCAQIRQREKLLPLAAHAFQHSQVEERLWVRQRPLVGVVLAVAQHEVIVLDTRTVRLGLAWNRWFALQRHIEAYEWVFTADPDQFISHQCFLSYSFTDVLREAQVKDMNTPRPVIIMRDFPRFHTLNSAGVFFRGVDHCGLPCENHKETTWFGGFWWGFEGLHGFSQMKVISAFFQLEHMKWYIKRKLERKKISTFIFAGHS
eukprot:symbB.v1.2.020949.t1/scaffold1788.1/size101334/4